MASRTICDGCGTEIADDTPTTGHFGKQYSSELRPVAEEYLAKLDELHTAAALQFTSELCKLRAHYREMLLKLPDEP